MTRFASRRRSPDPLDSLLSGAGARELGTGYEAVARLLSGLANAGGNVAAPQVQLGVEMIPVGLISTMAETVRMNQPRSPLWRRLRFVSASGVTKLLIVGGVLVGGTAAAAATGSLPSPIQHSVTRVLSAIGIDQSGHNVPNAAGAVRQVTRPGSVVPVKTIRCPSMTAKPAKPGAANTSSTLVAGLPRKCVAASHHNGVPARHRARNDKRTGLGKGRANGNGTTTTTGPGDSRTGRKSTNGPPAGKGSGAKKATSAGKRRGAKKATPAGKGSGAKKATPAGKGSGAKKATPAGKGSGAENPGGKGKGT
jgi:hypothetical protein